MGDEERQREDYIRALLHERAGCERSGLADRVADIDRELVRVGHKEAAQARSQAQPKTPRARRARAHDTAAQED